MKNETPNSNAIGAEKPQTESEPPKKPVEKTYTDEEVVMRTDAAEKRRNARLITLPFRIFELIWDYAWNPGKRAEGDHLALYEEITAVGLKVNPIVSVGMKVDELIELLKDAKNDKRVVKALLGLCGHLRSIGVRQAKAESPKAFAKFWANGIQVEAIEGLTDTQKYYIACDHDTVSRSKPSIIQQAIEMFKRGCTEKDVALTLWDELNIAFRPLNGKQKAKIREAKGVAAKAKAMFLIRRGAVQNIHYYATKLPDYCLQAYMREVKGEEGEKLKHADAVDLHTAQGEVGTKANPTKAFTDLYALRIKTYGQKDEGPKVLNKKQLMEFFGQYRSPFWEALRLHIMGEAKLNFDDEDMQLLACEQGGDFGTPNFTTANASIKKRLDAANAKAV